MSFDVLVSGAGPAGTALVAACAARGLRVGWLAPEHREGSAGAGAPWTATYASWVDEVDAEVSFDARWDVVYVHAGREHTLRRPYGRIAGEPLRARLTARAVGVEVLRGAVVSVEHVAAGTSVRDDRGRVHRAAVHVAATGSSGARAFQTAHGRFVTLEGLDPAHPRWMDFSHRFDDGEPAPSFLYALPFADGRWLVEETSLLRAPGLTEALLSRRLDARLRALGVTVREVHGTESVAIPMDAPPVTTGPSLAFGAAAGMVHPATGYLVARVLAAAPRVADALVRGLERGPTEALTLARAATWPADALRRHRVLRYAAGVLGVLDGDQCATFFDAFFSCPRPFVDGFLGDRLAAGDLVRGMADLFRALPAGLRWRVMSAGDPAELWRAARAAA
jgi:lycopene beta-cyclase